MQKRFKFTTTKLQSLPPNDPSSRSTEAEYSDTEITGFKLLIGKSGTKKYLIRYVLNGKKGSASLGTFPEVPLSIARKQAQRIKLLVGEGINPKESANSQEIPSVSDYFHNHYIKVAKTRKKTWKHDVARFNHCSDVWGIGYDQLKVSHIQSMIAKLMDKVHWRGTKFSKSSLNRILCVLKAMGRMVELEYGIPSVAHRVKLFPETGARQRWLSPREIKMVFAELRKEEYCPIRSRFIILLFMLGCREKSLRAAKWLDIDLESGVMRIPRELSKSGYEHQIYLTPESISEFKALQLLQKGSNPFVFPGNKPNSYISQPRSMFNNMKQRLNLKDADQIVFHTARHSYAGVLISSGVDVGVLKQLLGHRSINSTMRYAKISSDKQRESAQLLTQVISEA